MRFNETIILLLIMLGIGTYLIVKSLPRRKISDKSQQRILLLNRELQRLEAEKLEIEKSLREYTAIEMEEYYLRTKKSRLSDLNTAINSVQTDLEKLESENDHLKNKPPD